MPYELEYNLNDGTVVLYEDSFLIVGGYDLDTIYKYGKESDTFESMEARLPFPVSSPIAILVDVDIFPACPSTTTSATTTVATTTTASFTTTSAAFTTTTGYPPTTTRYPTTTARRDK